MSGSAPQPPHPLQKKLAQAWQLHQAGKLDQALAAYREITRKAPQLADAWQMAGLAFIQKGDPARAVKLIQRGLKIDAGNPQSWFNLGIALKDQGKFREALEPFSRAAEKQPRNPAFLSALGNIQRLTGQAEKSIATLSTAARIAPGQAEILSNLAHALNDLGAIRTRSGDHEEAAALFEKALHLDPRQAQAQLNLGINREQAGALEDAERHYLNAIAAAPRLADAHFQLAQLRTHAPSRIEVKSMQRLLEAPETPSDSKIKLAFALGFALERRKEFDRAFSFMQRGHQLQAEQSTYDAEKTRLRFEGSKSTFNASFFSELGSGAPDDRPVFIVGMPRSGTTLAEQVLAAHSQTHARGESTLLSEVARGMSGYSEEAIQQTAPELLRHITADSGTASRVIDTTPMNFLLVGIAAALLPGARFVLCKRDPLDNCLSLYRQYLTGANEFSHDLEQLGHYYLMHEDLMTHWTSVLPERTHVLTYEKLVTETRDTVSQLLEFLELPFEDACLRPDEAARRVMSPSAAQVRQAINSGSIGSWQRYRQHLSPLINALGQ